jgi:predicted acylesterase/phospholipase RssA
MSWYNPFTWRPQFPFGPTQHSEQVEETRLHSPIVRMLAVVFQVAAAGGVAWAWWKAGASHIALAIGLLVATVCCFMLDWLTFRQLKNDKGMQKGGLLGWMSWIGFWCLFGAGSLLFQIIGRFSFRFLQVIILIMAATQLVFGARLLQVDPKAGRSVFGRQIGWSWLTSALVLVPILVGWLAASSVIVLLQSDAATVRAWLDGHPSTAKACPAWTANGRELHIALALSGGGYRAAVTHAGVLAALDDQCVPLDLLSSVSGGSIIGASYALGLPPREFAARLIRQKPGLPDSMLSVTNLFRSTSTFYADHFREIFFGNRTLASLPDSPRLLINVTNKDVNTDHAREILFNGGTGLAPEREDKIAEAVAASGAYPGAFGPIQLPWIDRTDGKVIIGPHSFLDGGVVENLGVEGLRKYLTEMTWLEWYLRHPDLLIVSDASGYASALTGDRLVINPPADETLERANDIQFDALHRFLYAYVTGQEDLLSKVDSQPAWRQFYSIPYPASLQPNAKLGENVQWSVMTEKGPDVIKATPQKLTTVVIAITAAATGRMLDRFKACVGPEGKRAAAVQARVSGFSTLYELTADEVREAFWLGYALGRIYGQSIECARRQLNGQSCDAALDAAEVTCPSFEQLVKLK